VYKENIKLIKENVSIIDVLNLYGIKLNYKNMCICPIHKDSNPSFKFYEDGHFKCYGCGKNGDVIDLIKSIENISQFEAINFLLKRFNLKEKYQNDKDYKPRIIQQAPSKTIEHFKNPKVINYVRECMQHITETDYFIKRGLSPHIIKRFKLGYNPKLKIVIIPYNRACSYYQSRSINGKTFYKIPNKEAGSEPIFNEGVLSQSSVVFVVESPICAMSITQCGGSSVPLCGVVNVRKLLKYLDKNFYDGTLVLCLDNDIAGENATKELINGIPEQKIKGLNELKINYLVENIADECKDPNELLMKKWYRLRVNIKRVLLKIGR